jgi:hypothetical protein
MYPGRSIASIALAVVASLSAARAQQPVETRHPNGELHERYTLDEAGRRTESTRSSAPTARRCGARRSAATCFEGYAIEYFDDGKTLKNAGEYRAGERHGSWVFVGDDKSRRKKAEYKLGHLSGTVTVEIADKIVSKQKWKDGGARAGSTISCRSRRRRTSCERS